MSSLMTSSGGRWIGSWALVAFVLAGALLFVDARAAHAQSAGYRDFSYAAPSGTPFAPTGEKPQSKLWFNDGIWWGSLFDGSPEAGEDPSGQYEIYRFDQATQRWSETNVPLDTRNTSKADTLWDGQHLYVATAVPSNSTSDPKAYVLRYSYNAATKTYTRDPGFPVVVAPVSGGAGGIEAIVVDKDSTGKFWVTYAQRNAQGVYGVYVNRSTSADGATWGTPFVLPVAGTSVTGDDISAVVRFDSNKIGVMWSNQNDGTFYFATHNDGDPDNVWQGRVASQCPRCADDHISLASLEADSAGRVYAAVKTSLNDATTSNPGDPLVWLLVLGTNGSWKPPAVFGRVQDDHTRPIVKIDQTNRKVYVFATAPCCDGGTIYYKRANLADSISFPSGRGTPFIQSSTDTHINNVTSSKQNLTAASGLLLLASDDTSDFYLHNSLELAPPDTTITSGPSGTVNTSSASFGFSSTETGSTFECALDAAAFSGCASPKSYAGLANGSHTFEVRATDAAGNTDATPASRTWTVDAMQSRSIPCVIDTKIAEKSPTKIYGSAATNGMDGDEPKGSDRDIYALIKCDVSGVPSNADIFSASVTLNVTNPSAQTYEAYELKRTWAEPEATWNVYASGKPWEVAGARGPLDRSAAVVGAATPSATGKYTFALSSSVAQNWLSNPANNRGMILADPGNADGADFSSGEAAPSLLPQINVTYVLP